MYALADTAKQSDSIKKEVEEIYKRILQQNGATKKNIEINMFYLQSAQL